MTSRTSQAAEAGLGDESIELGSQELQRLRAGIEILALRALGDREAAEEVAQEALTRAIKALQDGRLKEREKLGAFVRGIAHHVIADVARDRQRTSRLEDMSEATPSTVGPDPLSLIISEEERERVRVALTELSEPDQEILHLSFFEGFTPSQIAESLEEPPELIRKRKSRALARLRRALLGKP